MDELGATLRRISKFLGRQGVDAAAASVSRLEYSPSFAGACELTGSYQARAARAHKQEKGLEVEETSITVPAADPKRTARAAMYHRSSSGTNSEVWAPENVSTCAKGR